MRSFCCERRAPQVRSPLRQITKADSLFPDQLDQNSFSATSVELAIENLLPRPKIETALGDGHDDFTAHHLSFEVGVAVVLAGLIVPVPTERCVGGKFFKPAPEILMQSPFVIIDEDGCGDVHGVDEAESFTDAALHQAALDVIGDIDESHAFGGLKPEFLAVAFHRFLELEEENVDFIIGGLGQMLRRNSAQETVVPPRDAVSWA